MNFSGIRGGIASKSAERLLSSHASQSLGHLRLAFSVWLVVTIVIAGWTVWHAKPDTERMVYSDVATHVMIASSVWHDFDLKYSLDDLARFQADYPADSGPRGLFLKKTSSGELVYAKPYLYGATAAVFYGAFGVDGFAVLNSICLFVIGLVATLALARAFGLKWGLAASLGLVLPSPFLAWAAVPHPDLFIAALLAGSGYYILHNDSFGWPRLLLGVVLLGAAIHEKPVFVVLLPFLLLAMPGPRCLKRYVVIACGVALSWLLLSLPNLLDDGTLFSYQGVRFYVAGAPFPMEEGWIAPATKGITAHIFSPLLIATSLLSNLSLIPAKLVDFVVGRQTGILVYFPIALWLLLVGAVAGLGAGLWLFAGFFAYLGLNWLAFPSNGYGGAGTYGPRYMMQVLPVILLAFLRCPGSALKPSGQILKVGLVAACLIATVLHHRVFVLGEDTVRMHRHRFIEAPLNSFPVESWLLPTLASSYPENIRERSPSGNAALFNKSFFDQSRHFSIRNRRPLETRVLFQFGERQPVEDLILWPVADADVVLKQGYKVLWKGSLRGRQPVRVDAGLVDFDSEAFDLLGKKFVRFVEFEILSDGRGGEGEAPILRFAQDLATFNAFGRDLYVAEFAQSGVSLLRGWSRIEPWGVWSDGGIAQLVLHVGDAPGSYEVVLSVGAYVPPEDPVRKVLVTVNGRPFEELELRAEDGERQLRYRFQSEQDEHYINLGFEIRNPVSPALLGRGRDARMLGVALRSMKIERVIQEGKWVAY